MSTPAEAAQRLLSIKGPYNWPTGERTVSREDDEKTVAEAYLKLQAEREGLWKQVNERSVN